MSRECSLVDLVLDEFGGSVIDSSPRITEAVSQAHDWSDCAIAAIKRIPRGDTFTAVRVVREVRERTGMEPKNASQIATTMHSCRSCRCIADTGIRERVSGFRYAPTVVVWAKN